MKILKNNQFIRNNKVQAISNKGIAFLSSDEPFNPLSKPNAENGFNENKNIDKLFDELVASYWAICLMSIAIRCDWVFSSCIILKCVIDIINHKVEGDKQAETFK